MFCFSGAPLVLLLVVVQHALIVLELCDVLLDKAYSVHQLWLLYMLLLVWCAGCCL